MLTQVSSSEGRGSGTRNDVDVPHTVDPKEAPLPRRSETRSAPSPRLLPQLTPYAAPARVLLRVLICEDQEIYRVGLRALIDDAPDLTVVGEAADVPSACALADRFDPHVVLVRHALLPHPEPGPGLGELVRRGAVLVLAESESEADLVHALRGGARGYLSRRLAAPRLLDGIRAVARDEPALDPAVARHLVHYLTDDVTRGGAARTPLEQLTDRQRAVALLVAEGLTNAEIAARLYLSQATVKTHLTAVLRRLNIHGRTRLAVLINHDPKRAAAATTAGPREDRALA